VANKKRNTETRLETTPMASLARADLESLLRTRKLDVTLTSARPLAGAAPRPEDAVATGLEALDWRLGGGVPRGQVSSIAGPASSGRTSVLCGLLASTTAGGELAALIDTRDTFDPESAAAAGVALPQLLWVRGGPVSSADSLASTIERQVDRALKALTLVLQAGGFGLAALDLADVPPPVVRRLPFTTWLRLARMVEGGRTACVLVGAQPIARSPGGVTMTLESGRVVSRWSGEHDRARIFRGLEVRPRVA
jgi:hypothetical protein